MSYGQTVRRGGGYNRLAEPSWAEPLDTSHSKARGGRWNPPAAFGALYLNADPHVARLQVRHKLAGQPFDVEDLDPTEQHDLLEVHVDPCDPLDCVSTAGLSAVGLSDAYPLTDAGDPVPHVQCQGIAHRVFDADLPGIACRSATTAAAASDEELAVFDRDLDLVHQTGRRPFVDWYLEGDAP